MTINFAGFAQILDQIALYRDQFIIVFDRRLRPSQNKSIFHVGFCFAYCSRVSFLTVNSSIRFSFTS